LDKLETPLHLAAVSQRALAATSEHRPQQATLLPLVGKRCFLWMLFQRRKNASKKGRQKEFKQISF
jgi:hypothetical protein